MIASLFTRIQRLQFCESDKLDVQQRRGARSPKAEDQEASLTVAFNETIYNFITAMGAATYVLFLPHRNQSYFVGQLQPRYGTLGVSGWRPIGI
jgi:hypothetical protein